MSTRFLPGVPEDYVLARFAAAGGNEIESGKFDSPESSARLAANAFGWFVPRPDLLPTLPGLQSAGAARRIQLEFNARFPWAGGTHPWLDAAVFTETHLIGVESKRFEPFRDRKVASFSEAYERPVWGDAMTGFSRTRAALTSGAVSYRHLDAAQLIKHACGLVTEGRRSGLRPALVYIYAEPAARDGRPIATSDHDRHRREIVDFAARVAGDAVMFSAASYREWLTAVAGEASGHRSALLDAFDV